MPETDRAAAGVSKPADGLFHLFLVHSHITHLVARAVVRHHQLDPAKVVFLVARGFAVPANADGPIRSVSFGYELVPRKRKQRPSMWQGWKILAGITAQLRQLTAGHGFHFYTPQTLEPLAQVLKHHSDCRSFSFIEEGLHSYCTRAEIGRTHPLRRPRLWERLAYLDRTGPAMFFDPGYRHAYGVAAAVFPDLERRVVLDDVFLPADPQRVDGIDQVLVFDSLAVYRRMRQQTLIDVVQRLLQQLSDEQAGVLHYKFHPAQAGTPEQSAIEAVLRQGGIETRRLDDDIALEGVALARPQTRFYVNLSSVGLYAALLGANAWSFAPWVAEVEPEFQRYIDLTPKVFGEHVGMLR